MTVEQGLATSGAIFIFAALVCAMGANRWNDLDTVGWTAFVMAIVCWLAATWLTVLT